MTTTDKTIPAQKAVAARLVRACLASGHVLSVNDGEEWTVKRSAKAAEVIDALHSTDVDTLLVRTASGERVGAFVLMLDWGSDGPEVIQDHTANDECERLYRAAVR